MAEIIPFQGIYYNRKKIKQIKKVTSPPYDVISKKKQEYFYRLHLYNVIRLILGKSYSNDTKTKNRNTRSREYFQNWLKEGILKKDSFPVIYIYRQRYTRQNKLYTCLGFIALDRLEGWRKKKVLPHEVTFAKFRRDRLKLLRSTKANFESILSLYPHSGAIEKILKKGVHRRPFIKIVDEEKAEHAIFPFSDKKEISIIQKEMKKRPLFIADGHHRYQAALEFSRETAKAKAAKCKSAGHLMVTFMDMERNGLTIFPTHRLICKLPRSFRKRLFTILGSHFQVKKTSARTFPLDLKKEGKKSVTFGLCLEGDEYFLIKLKPEVDFKSLIKGKKSADWKKLDVTILHKLILDKLLNGRGEIFYTRDLEEARIKVKEGKAQLAFFLNPTKIEDIKAVASRGERMPPKSTYFYPKLRSGLIMREMNG